MTETRFRTKNGSVLDAVYAMARLSDDDVGKIILTVEDCKMIRTSLLFHDLDTERYGYKKGFNEAMHFVRAKPWYKRIRL